MKVRQGFTLMELLVVLLIIGILSTVALRTIDATRDRSLFDQTTKEMNQLVQAIVGNPDLAYDGRRVDFGYYGDMEQLPESLRQLVLNTSGSPAWRGPYFKLMSAGDSVSYLNDGWGNLYTYRPGPADIYSGGNGKFPMTVKIVDDTAQLHDNIISGSFLDHDGNPPGVAGSNYEVRLYWNNPPAHATPNPLYAVVHPAPGGYYEIALHPSDPIWPRLEVPIGTKKLQAIIPDQETLTRYVTVSPRSHVVADFKFNRTFAGRLQMIGQPTLSIGGDGFVFNIANASTDTVNINWLTFQQAPDSAYMRDFHIGGNPGTTFPRIPPTPAIGQGDTVRFTTVAVGPNLSDEVELAFGQFYVDSLSIITPANLAGKTFTFRFSDGSEIEVPLP